MEQCEYIRNTLDNFCEMRGHYNHMEATERIAAEVKQSAYEIIPKKEPHIMELPCQLSASAKQS